MAGEKDPRFDPPATRWVGRRLAERPHGLADGRYALLLVERLLDGVEPLRLPFRREQHRAKRPHLTATLAEVRDCAC